MYLYFSTGYDVILQDKEKGRSNVLRLSHPGCETHFLSTDSPSEIQTWMNRIEALCFASPSETGDDKSNGRVGTTLAYRVFIMIIWSYLISILLMKTATSSYNSIIIDLVGYVVILY